MPNEYSKLFLIGVFLKCIWHFQKFSIPICHAKLHNFRITQRCHRTHPLASSEASPFCSRFQVSLSLYSPSILWCHLCCCSKLMRLSLPNAFTNHCLSRQCVSFPGSQITASLQKILYAYLGVARFYLRQWTTWWWPQLALHLSWHASNTEWLP